MNDPGELQVVGARRTVMFSLTATVATQLPSFLVGGMAIQLGRDIGMTTTALGVAVGGFFAAGALSSIGNGRLVERIGPERSLRCAVLTSAAVQLALGSVTRTFATLLALMLVGGLANALAQPASNLVIARGVQSSKLGLALGLQKSAIPLAALLAGLAVPTVALTVGWRWAFIGGAAIAIASALRVPKGAGSGERAAPAAKRHRPDVPTRHLALLAVGVGLGTAAANGLFTFIVLTGVDAGLSEARAGVMLTVGSLAGLVVRLVIGARADRYPGKTLRVIATMFAAASVSFLLLSQGSPWLFMIGTPLAFATAYAWPGLFHLAVIRSNPSAPAAATGLAMTGTFTGGVIGPVLFGIILDDGEYRIAWVVGAAGLLLAAVIVAICSTLIDEQPQLVSTAVAL